MKTLLPIYAAAILAATVAQAHAQDDLDSVSKSLTSPTPAPPVAATPRPAATAPTSRTTATAAPRPTVAPAAPRETVKDQLAKGHFVSQGDLAALAGAKVAPNTFLVGMFKATGSSSAGRKEFADAGLFGGKTKLLIRFPVTPDPKILQPGYSSKWEKAAPLRVESVASTGSGVTVYATDVTP